MERLIKTYFGNDIKKEQIQIMKDIAKNVYPKEIYDGYFKRIKTPKDLIHLHDDIPLEDQVFVLGEDWFICYAFSNDMIKILEWIAVDNHDTKFTQSIEMMKAFKMILLENDDQKFNAFMRHNTSYQIYSRLKNHKLLHEINHGLFIDEVAPVRINRIKLKLSMLSDSGDEVLNSGRVVSEEHLKYFLHEITFSVTDKFVERYAKSKKRTKEDTWKI